MYTRLNLANKYIFSGQSSVTRGITILLSYIHTVLYDTDVRGPDKYYNLYRYVNGEKIKEEGKQRSGEMT